MRCYFLSVIALCASAAAAAQSIEEQLLREAPADLAEAAREHGDAARGAIVFHQPFMACAKCHQNHDDQPSESLGPILSVWKKVPSDDDLIDAVLRPSKDIRKGFEPVAVTIRQRSRAHAYPGGSPVHVTLIADGPTGLALGCEIVGKEGAALRANILATALAAHMTVADIQNLDLVYAPPFASVWDPVLVAANQLSKKIGRKR